MKSEDGINTFFLTLSNFGNFCPSLLQVLPTGEETGSVGQCELQGKELHGEERRQEDAESHKETQADCTAEARA